MSVSGIIACGLTQNVGEILLNGLESGAAAPDPVNGTPTSQPAGDPSWETAEEPTEIFDKWEGD